MMAWMSDGVANSSKEIERPCLRDRQTEAYLVNKQDEQNFAKGASHFFGRILTYFEQSFNRYDNRPDFSMTIMSTSTSVSSSFAGHAVV